MEKQESNFLYHTPCNNCGSSDANSVYDDGHSYCFSCNTTTRGNDLTQPAKEKTDLREFLTHHIHNPKRRIALAAIDSLGQLGDPRVIATLEKFTNNAEGDSSRKAAEQAIEKIRAGRKPADDYKNLRKEVTNLKQSTD